MPPATLLPALIAHSRHTARIVDGRLQGEGAEFLRELARNGQFVLLGEDHGASGIAEFATAYWRDLNALGYQYAALEVDPWLGDAVVGELRGGGPGQWGRYLNARGATLGAPFLNWAPEVALARSVTQTSRARAVPPIWGLDQVYIGSAIARLHDIAEGARNPAARALAGELARGGAEAHSWFPTVDAARLKDLRALLSSPADARWAGLADALIVSHRIYAPFTGHGGEAYLANDERETLMKRTFLARYQAALAADRTPPKVMLKFGANHLTRGATPTHVQGLGGFITEFATALDQRAVAVLLACGPGSAVGGAANAPCDPAYKADGFYAFLGDTVSRDELTIYDFRVWRLRPRRWEHLPYEARQTIDSYDVMVVIPGRPASPWAEGLDPPK